MEIGESKTVTWEMEDWNTSHELFAAAQASCFGELGTPKVALRFFLKPVLKRTNIHTSSYGYSVETRWYALCVEVFNSHQNVTIKVDASEASSGIYAVGYISLGKAKGKVTEVIEEFLHMYSGHLDTDAANCTRSLNGSLLSASIVKIALKLTAFHLKETGNDAEGASAYSGNEEQTEAEESLISDLRSMYVAEENFADLQLETKDNMTLSAHKFQLAARSTYLRKMIEDAVKKNDFDGTIKMEEVNGKPLAVILHWMYTGELQDNAGFVMEEVVDASILFGLTHLLKVLDRKLISICTKENMFRLYQVAQKNAMPTAMDDLSAYIREHI